MPAHKLPFAAKMAQHALRAAFASPNGTPLSIPAPVLTRPGLIPAAFKIVRNQMESTMNSIHCIAVTTISGVVQLVGTRLAVVMIMTLTCFF